VLALVYDVHGNLPALEAVLEDARGAGADGFLLGGDYAIFGAWPQETLALLRELEPATWIRGNGERWVGSSEPPGGEPADGGAAACRAAIGEQLAAELAALPESAPVDGDRAWHASPVSDMRSFYPEPAADEAELLRGVSEPRLIFGHTHLPFRRISAHGGIELVNPGSVGMPLDGDPRAAYALVHPDRSVEHRRVAYDNAASAAELRARFGPAEWVEIVAARVERARP
jgi:predicted phosphodiesterase